jgi:hypothetical protein
MIYKKLALLAAATVIGTALIAPDVASAAKGGGGWRGGGGWHGGHAFAAHVGGVRVVNRAAFVNRPVFVNRTVFVNRPFFHHRRHFVRRFFGVGPVYVAGYSCWRWIPTVYGPRRIWVCGDDYGIY